MAVCVQTATRWCGKAPFCTAAGTWESGDQSQSQVLFLLPAACSFLRNRTRLQDIGQWSQVPSSGEHQVTVSCNPGIRLESRWPAAESLAST